MLDGITKKRIDTLRQILVGKLPDPKAQVEQITNGLIYKFMNDMDEESISMGGKSTYFSGKYQKYSWKNLLDTKTSGVEKLSLYSEAIEQMYNNENLPELFREIFKNSFLPFKDPSTLNMFLKEINEFHYSNSEKLGDAFEYLLSLMGSQGDAGQFRTPRHIIDFIVEIVNPQKNETILDPACGTAGFLISSYKHILKQNTKKNLGDGLTSSDRKKIGENLNGYDISPDMVKMSLVNMYLHKFTNPKINEYDTLSSEDRWNEYYDVILANPPFFSPKGGITPHNRFGVKSTKAEVLFVDYINEHLKPNGRAGIIVPEGIIFQGGTAYKQLRKRLIETSLIGVVSLPAGVFQPYSGVKTSILILDKEKSKKNKDIFFVKIDNDGYSLNSNRNKINDNDFPNTILNIKNDKNLNKIQKINLLNADDISFVPSKYIEEKVNKNLKFSRIKISEITDIFSGSRDKGGSLDKGIPSIGGGQIGKNGDILNDKMVFVSEKHFNLMNKGHLQNGDILIVKDGATTGKIGFYKGEFLKASINEHIFALRTKKNYNNYFLYYLLQGSEFQKKLKPFIQGIIGGINLKFSSIEIPHPSREIQNQIVEELVSYQKIIDGCRQVIGNYKPSIDIDPNWKMVELNEVCNFKRGPFGGSLKKEIFKDKGYLVYEQYHAINDDYSKERYFIDKKKFEEMKGFAVKKNDLIISCSGTMGKISIIPKEFKEGIINQALLKLTTNEELVLPFFLKFYLQSTFIQNKYFTNQSGSVIQNVASVQVLKKIPFPKIDLILQEKIVEKIKEELDIIKLNKKLLISYKSKIEETINKIWSN
jgi:type I restriction enzyme M protein